MRELSLHVMDIVQNSIAAGASHISVTIEEITAQNLLIIRIGDNGRGMRPEQLAMAQDPFYTTRTTRNVGLGVPFFKMAAEMTGGTFSISSEVGKGTSLEARFVAGHIDMVPLGAMDETILLLISANPLLDFTYVYTRDAASFTLDTRQLREILGDVPLTAPNVTIWLKEYLAEHTAAICKGDCGGI